MTFLPERYGAFPVEETREVEAAGRGDEWAARERIHTVYARPIPEPAPEPRPAPRARRGTWVMPYLAGLGTAMVIAVAEASLFDQLGLAAALVATYLAIALILHVVPR